VDLLLFAQWKTTPPGPAATKLRNRLVEQNLAIVHQVAKAFARGPDYDDMAQAGAIGLMVALDRFDPAKGAFFTYAKTWVLYEIQKAASKKKGTTKSTKLYTGEDLAQALYGQGVDAVRLTGSLDDTDESPGLVFFGMVMACEGISDTNHDLDRLLAGMSRPEVEALLALADGATSEEIATALGIPAESKAARAKARGQMAYTLLKVKALARLEDPEPDPLPPPPPPREWPSLHQFDGDRHVPQDPLPCWACICRRCDAHP
jgi:RNA polymerase sigma factor (sigma-70 family)